jgi:2-(1,2-epoxy-1,2-dihydrophenyl)acetyl-CoA isomerase
MDFASIKFEKGNDGVAVLTLNRPDKLNALTLRMADELLGAISMARDDDDVRVLVLTGAGRGFCSGTDLSSLRSLADREGFGEFGTNRSQLRGPTPVWVIPLATMAKPTIAAVNGVAAGAGFSMALGCDIRIASEQARFAPVWIDRGLIPEAGSTYFLPRLVGRSKAMQIAFTGEVIEAREAERIGLVSKVVPGDQLLPAVRQLATRIAAKPPIAIELAKQALLRGSESDLTSAVFNENRVQSICHMTDDHREAVKAFLEKRPPVFRGR